MIHFLNELPTLSQPVTSPLTIPLEVLLLSLPSLSSKEYVADETKGSGVEARPDGEKQDVRSPEEMTEADRTRLDPLSHRPEGGEWEKEKA